DNPDEGFMAVGVTRTNQQLAKGFGKAFRGIIVVEDIIFTTRVDTFDIRMDSTRLISPRMESYITDPVAIQFNNIVTSTKRPVYGSNELKVFPNPTRNVLNIELDNSSDIIQNINLYNFVGQSVEKVTFMEGRTSYRMLVAHLSRGMYTIITESKRGLYSQKVFIH
ncbi:MAG: T9SS type A sorting domain-containing protein, partial [Bacteroidota bacterium]